MKKKDFFDKQHRKFKFGILNPDKPVTRACAGRASRTSSHFLANSLPEANETQNRGCLCQSRVKERIKDFVFWSGGSYQNEVKYGSSKMIMRHHLRVIHVCHTALKRNHRGLPDCFVNVKSFVLRRSRSASSSPHNINNPS